MRYRNVKSEGSAPQTVDAVRLTQTTILVLDDGAVEVGSAGDYLVTFPDGMQGIVFRESFHAVYAEATYQGPLSVPVRIEVDVAPLQKALDVLRDTHRARMAALGMK